MTKPGAGSERTAWLVAGAVCVALVSAIVYKVTTDAPSPAVPAMTNVGSDATGAPGTPSTGIPTGPEGTPPDISQMTPRQRFDRLFNRIMTAAEQSQRAQVEQFTPMALGAYSQLEAPDADARYHAAIIYLQIDDAAAALALADTILAESPGHLFGYIVRGTAADMRKDAAAQRQAQRDFLAHYDAEMKANRVEYVDHRPVMDEFKRAADAAGSGSR